MTRSPGASGDRLAGGDGSVSGGPSPAEGRGWAFVSQARLYSHLVTRPTGRAVRMGIQDRIAGRTGPVIAVLDFRNVSIIDFSCADEVAAKLASSALDGAGSGPDLFFLFTGLEDHHLDPVESALRRREVAVAAERGDGSPFVAGELPGRARRAWARVWEAGGAAPEDVAQELGTDPAEAARLLGVLHRRRLLLRRAGQYLSLRRAVAEVTGPDGPR